MTLFTYFSKHTVNPRTVTILNHTFSNVSLRPGKPMKTNCFWTMKFHYSSKSEKPIKTNCFFNNFVFTKIHLENPYRIFAVRISVFDRNQLFLLYVCSRLNIFFWACHLRPFIYREVRALSTNQIQFTRLTRNIL